LRFLKFLLTGFEDLNVLFLKYVIFDVFKQFKSNISKNCQKFFKK